MMCGVSEGEDAVFFLEGVEVDVDVDVVDAVVVVLALEVLDVCAVVVITIVG